MELEKRPATWPAWPQTRPATVAAPMSVASASISPPQLPSRPTSQSSMSQFLQKAVTPAKQDSIDEKLAKMIAQDFQPFSIVEDKGFRSYTYALNPMYTLPSRKTLSQKIIPGLYDRERAFVCLTTDCWTSRTTTSYMSVTCHFIEKYNIVSCLLDCFEFSDRQTSDNLAEQLLRVAKEWDVEDKVVCCVSDNAANITKAIKTLKWTHHPCLAHTINLCVRDALKVMKPNVKVKQLWSSGCSPCIHGKKIPQNGI